MRKLAALTIAMLMLVGAGLAQSSGSQIEFEKLQTEPAPLQSGEYADIWIRATNTGDSTATNPIFRVKDEFPFQTTGRNEWEPRGELGVGESYDFRFQVKVSENAVFGENNLKMEASGSGQRFIQHDIPLEVRTSDRSLVVDSLEMSERMAPGTSHEMELTLENQENQRFRNIDVSLETEDTPVATRETSRKRIGSIDSQDTATAEFVLDVDPDADRELYKLPINIDYENQGGDEFSVTETTGVNVGGFPDVQVGIEDRDLYTPGRGSVTLRLVNRGEGQARFAQVEVEETDNTEVISESSVYLGTMISDDYQTAEFDLYTDEDETLEIPVTLDYRDGDGYQQENFTIERDMYSSDQLRRYGMDGSSSAWILGVLAILALIIGGIVWKKRKNEE